VRIPAGSAKIRGALSQYIARPPLSLKKINIEQNGEATAISYTSDNEFFKGKAEIFSVTQFLLELTQYIPPRGLQYIRKYGLYASRTKGKWSKMPHVMRLAPAGWKAESLQASDSLQLAYEESTISDQESRRTWAKLIAQLYEFDPLTCSRCGSPMRILAVITEPEEVRKILRHLAKVSRPPRGWIQTSCNLLSVSLPAQGDKHVSSAQTAVFPDRCARRSSWQVHLPPEAL
jgi:hypothetical protein